MANEVCLETHYTVGNVRKLLFDVTCDDADGSLASEVEAKIEGRLLQVVTNPDAGTPPQINYDLSLVDQHGHDVLETVGQNRHNVNTETADIFIPVVGTHPVVDETDTLTLTIPAASNNVNSARVAVEISYALGA